MCGIVYVQRKDGKPAHKQVIKRYKAQSGRGSEGFGYIAIKQSGNATAASRFQFEHEALTELGATKYAQILFHHRYPTSTANVPESAHPIRVSHQALKYDYSVVHNGVISNDEELKDKHEALGYVYTTEIVRQLRTRRGHVYEDGIEFNDSEALAIELARNIEGISKEVEAKGTIAYIVVQIEKDTQRAVAMYYGTNGGNPLTIEDRKEYLCIASEGGKAIPSNTCYRMSLPDNTTTEYPQVCMEPVWTPAPTTGYLPTRCESDLDREEYVGSIRRTEDREIADLEEEIAGIEEEIIGLSGDIEFALHEGDLEEEEAFRNQYAELMERRNKLNSLYLQKANAKASAAK